MADIILAAHPPHGTLTLFLSDDSVTDFAAELLGRSVRPSHHEPISPDEARQLVEAAKGHYTVMGEEHLCP